jgi:hypothetical protein
MIKMGKIPAIVCTMVLLLSISAGLVSGEKEVTVEPAIMKPDKPFIIEPPPNPTPIIVKPNPTPVPVVVKNLSTDKEKEVNASVIPMQLNNTASTVPAMPINTSYNITSTKPRAIIPAKANTTTSKSIQPSAQPVVPKKLTTVQIPWESNVSPGVAVPGIEEVIKVEIRTAGVKIAQEPKLTNKTSKMKINVTSTNGSLMVKAWLTLNKTSHSISIEKNSENLVVLNSNGVVANTRLPLELDTTGVYINISDTKKELKVLPDMLSKTETVNIKRIELKNIEQEPVYEVKALREGRVFVLFPVSMDIEMQVNANSGETEITKKPWWSVFCSGGA